MARASAGAGAGVVGMVDVSRNAAVPGDSGRFSLGQPATWSYVWTGAALGYLVFLYLAAGGFRGSVAS